MKQKVSNILSYIFLVISFIPLVYLVFEIINSYINGFEYQLFDVVNIPYKTGISGVYNFLYYVFGVGGLFTIIVFALCIIYQVLFFKNKNKKK